VELGEVSSGKSILMNLINCDVLLPSKAIPCTPTVCELRYGFEKRAEIYTKTGKEVISLEFGNPQEKIDAFFEGIEREDAESLRKIELYYPSPFLVVLFLSLILFSFFLFLFLRENNDLNSLF